MPSLNICVMKITKYQIKHLFDENYDDGDLTGKAGDLIKLTMKKN